MRLRDRHLRLRLRHQVGRNVNIPLQAGCKRVIVKFSINRIGTQNQRFFSRPPSFLRVLRRRVEDLLSFRVQSSGGPVRN